MNRRGMTLVELLIAIAIAGLVLLGGILLLDQLRDSASRIGRDSAANATAGNADHLLRRFLADAHATSDSADFFRGTEHAATYVTLCDTDAGWRERCRVTLSLDSLSDSTLLVAETDRTESFVIRRIGGAARWRFLDVASRDSAMLREWAPSMSMPSALAIIAGIDTAFFPLGAGR